MMHYRYNLKTIFNRYPSITALYFQRHVMILVNYIATINGRCIVPKSHCADKCAVKVRIVSF